MVSRAAVARRPFGLSEAELDELSKLRDRIDRDSLRVLAILRGVGIHAEKRDGACNTASENLSNIGPESGDVSSQSRGAAAGARWRADLLRGSRKSEPSVRQRKWRKPSAMER